MSQLNIAYQQWEGSVCPLPGLCDILNVLGFLADTVSSCYVVLFKLLLLRNYL